MRFEIFLENENSFFLPLEGGNWFFHQLMVIEDVLSIISFSYSKFEPKSRNSILIKFLRTCRSLKWSYLLMVTVGGALIGLNRCGILPSFILDGSRHPTSPNPSWKSAISDENVIFDKNLWFFENFFWLKRFLESFYLR